MYIYFVINVNYIIFSLSIQKFWQDSFGGGRQLQNGWENVSLGVAERVWELTPDWRQP